MCVQYRQYTLTTCLRHCQYAIPRIGWYTQFREALEEWALVLYFNELNLYLTVCITEDKVERKSFRRFIFLKDHFEPSLHYLLPPSVRRNELESEVAHACVTSSRWGMRYATLHMPTSFIFLASDSAIHTKLGIRS